MTASTLTSKTAARVSRLAPSTCGVNLRCRETKRQNDWLGGWQLAAGWLAGSRVSRLKPKGTLNPKKL
eukprot:365757-Chlamydomonas_euryale.AAC.6